VELSRSDGVGQMTILGATADKSFGYSPLIASDWHQ
jgi:hypothetical protein